MASRARRRHRDERGLAMITVMSLVLVLTLLLVAAVSYAVATQPLSRRDQDWNAALAAAQAGVDDYAYRLQQDDSYYSYSSTSPPPVANAAFTAWQTIPGPANEGQFHYTPSLAQFASQGTVQLTSTGRVRGVMRSIRVNLRRNFLDYLYFTNFETLDPQSGYYADPATAAAKCAVYWYAGRPSSPCVRISFASGDVLDGPLHSNDQITVNGSPTFSAAVTTGWTGTISCPPKANRYYGLNGCSDSPSFQPGDPKVASILTLPPSNTNLKNETNKSLGKTGCLFDGPTRITLNAAGTMTVNSPFTPTTGRNCVPTGTMALPANGVVYVENATSGSCSGSQNKLGYPITNDVTTYGCRDGDVFLSGTLKGQLTIGTENNIVVVSNVTYQTSGPASSDMLGLVANNFVQVYHPVSSSGTNLTDARNPTPTFQNPRIDAAILALNHSFIVQNYSNGAQLGTLQVNGVIAQQWRGPVGTSGGTGYLKDYNYDSRLKYQSPPHALDLSTAAFLVKAWAEVPTPSGLPP
jgi:hypothetical protein